MPPRWVSAGIVVFWLASTGWLFWSDLLPRMLPGQAPPYTIDAVEETQRQRAASNFTVLYNGGKAFRVQTQVNRAERDVYEMTASFTPLPGSKPVVAHGALVRKITSQYRVNGAGDLLGVSVTLNGTLAAGAIAGIPGSELTFTIAGDVDQNTLPLRATRVLMDRRSEEVRAENVPVGRGGSLLIPLHPVNRMRGLYPGQAWTTHALDPIPDAFPTGSAVRFLRARVRDEEEVAGQGRRQGELCLVIDYTGDGLAVTTWVSRKTGLVVAQEVKTSRDSWVLHRD